MKKMKKVWSLLLLTALIFTVSTSAYAQMQDPVKWSFEVKQKAGNKAEFIATADIENKWHLYATVVAIDPAPDWIGPMPTELFYKETNQDKYKAVGKFQEMQEAHVEYDNQFFAEVRFFEHQASFKQEFDILTDEAFEINFELSYQACDDKQCIFPFPIELNIRCVDGQVGDVYEGAAGSKEALKSTASSTDVQEEPVDDSSEESSEELPTDTLVTDVPVDTMATDSASMSSSTTDTQEQADDSTQDSGEKEEEKKGLLSLFLLCFAGGLAVLFTPCVFPMIPMTVSFFTKQSKDRKKGIRNAIMYGISIIVIYVILGTVVTLIFGADALNALSTNVWFNLFFFLMLVVFAISFLGAFELTLPNSWINKADQASDKGGVIGIFFMALVLALVSFSCTGPVVGPILVEAAAIGGVGPIVGMLGFSSALALPFTLFAIFPGWLNSLPKSGGWLNTVKVFLGFLELAFAFKFLSNADLVVQAHLLEREMFLAIWIGIFTVLAFYLFGKIQLPHDSKVEKISVGRALLGISTVIFVIYLIPGLWGAPLKLISGFPPPMNYSESPEGFGGSGSASSHGDHPEGTHLGPQGIYVFEDYDKGMAYAKEHNKPVFLDFTGYACVNCRRMEESVWGEPGVIDILKNDVVIISLFVDSKLELPKEEQFVEKVNGKDVSITTVGKKWSVKQINEYKTNTQPYYRMQDADGNDLSNGSADYDNHKYAEDFLAWLKEGLEEVKK